MGASSSSTEQHANPILYTFSGATVQPYWLIVVDLILLQILQRLYNRYTLLRNKHRRTWYISLEIAFLGERISKEKDLIDVQMIFCHLVPEPKNDEDDDSEYC